MQNQADALKSGVVKLILSIAFVGIGCWAVYLAIEMVGLFGEGMGVDERSRVIYSRAHVAIHVFGTASSLAVGLFLMSRRVILGIFCVLAILGCGVYGIFNMIGFASTNRLQVAVSRQQAIDNAREKYEKARQDLKERIGWAERTVAEEDSPREKKRMREYADKLTAQMSALEPPKQQTSQVLADSQATWFAMVFGTSAEKWQLTLPVPVAILLYVAEVLSFVFAMALLIAGLDAIGAWMRRPREPREPKSGGGSGGSGETKPKLVHTEPKPEPARLKAEPNKVRRASSRVPAGALKQSAFDRAYELAIANPHLSTRALAKAAVVSQMTGHRVKKKLRGKVSTVLRRYGNGGVHSPAYN